VAGGVLAVVFYILRMVTRLPRFGVGFGMDDVFMTIGIVSFSLQVPTYLEMQGY
jgi:hypothetical protein